MAFVSYPSCGKIVKDDADECVHCRHRLGSGAAVASAPEPAQAPATFEVREVPNRGVISRLFRGAPRCHGL
jgi:hypothetical protein